MAIFNPTPNSIDPTNYLGYSKEPDKIKPDTTLGTLFSNVAELGVDAVKAADSNIQRSFTEELDKRLNETRDAFTPGPTPVPDLAEDGEGNPLPPQAEGRLEALRRYAQANKAGAMTDSNYYAHVESIVREVKSRYQGYNEQIDNVVHRITGVIPANALRNARMKELKAAQSASAAADKAAETWYSKDREYIHTLFPGITKEQAIANRKLIEPQVGEIAAKELQTKIESQNLELLSKRDANRTIEAKRIATNVANQEVSSFVTGATNTLGTNFSELQKKVNTISQKGADANPQEIQALADQAVAIESEISARIDARFARPLSEGSANSLRTVTNPAELAAIKEQALSEFKMIYRKLGIKEYGVANAAANIVSMRSKADLIAIQNKFPATRALGAMDKMVDPTTMSLVLQNTAVFPQLQKALTDTTLFTIADTTSDKPVPSVSEALGVHKGPHQDRPVPPQVARVTVDSIQKLAESKNPALASRAVESLYNDPRFFAEVDSADKLKIFSKLGNPSFTQKMIDLGRSNPQAWLQYQQWMENAFKVVGSQGIADLQSALTYKPYDVTYDPKTMQWTAITKNDQAAPPSSTGKYQYPVAQDPAAFYVQKANQAMAVIAPVLKQQYGDQANARMMQLLKEGGLDVNAPKRGPLLEELWKKIPEFSMPEGVKNDSRVDPRSKNLSKENVLNMDIQDIPEGMSARDFLKKLQQEGK